MVIGVDDLLNMVRENDYLIVDGVSGMIFVNPAADIRAKYARRRDQHEKVQQELAAFRRPAVDNRRRRNRPIGRKYRTAFGYCSG